MSKDENEDLPKIVAAIAWNIPSLALRTGWAYLKMKKKAQRASKQVERGMIENGLPPEYARKLAEEFAGDLSIRRFIGNSRGKLFEGGMFR